MPWRGPSEEGEFPTLGYDVGEWIEAHVVVPDGYQMGKPFLLTDEMWRYLIKRYRLYPHAQPWPAPDALTYFGSQLRRVQKWGKDPLGAAMILANALGPSRFDGWNADGEPVGAPYPTPLIVCLGTSEDQTDNTWRPLLSMVRNGPLIDMSALDVGETRIVLPGGGKVEPVTTSARARLGAPMTHVTITESHLFTLQGGFRKVAGAVKRNVAGMDGTWDELTNGWDPTEASEAQVTAESADPRILIDTIEPNRVEDLEDAEAVYAELLRQYGDSARERGGWVNVRGRMLHEVQSKRHMEADRRRFFLNEIVVGVNVFVDPIRWDLAAREIMLAPGDKIALGFDGSRKLDATALIACRLEDGALFQLGVWEKPDGLADWRVPSADVDRRVRDVFAAYDVALLFADPYRWQDYLDSWSAAFPQRVVEFATNVEQRMDKAIERWSTAFGENQIVHDGSESLTKHCKQAVLVKGSKKKPRPGEEQQISTHYLKLAKRGDGLLIDAAVAAVLAYHARGQAIEDGYLTAGPTSLAGRLYGRADDD
ncbi:hypothetical protein [Lysinibacillus fusiformis]|uniref:hypothetical protein n=1 Tax=Lysinibacillus fusiformis TaxID=28031 RepID=UPI003CFCE52B